mmetsp:Transcript_13762/g.27488  ORF Transcript_13762/g.27488 Transcript_13762/m.27488 type:complete len:111 (+) Transcript_13762:84-416(+)|eukprot:CAMPEP_0181298826 /NCGR_PEP_ID=MMETSP1101-20121128/5995_1 /TAXON_ID=46948 /ORGANISM="Rhodomonas abbreviata, Strain Caron Lab Isolate" /LENGTH=110 /DNA_ID=CAMNT_0023403885 /DNA_START=67 /DNA_END=399 /DNA_ORIENTATION=-
MSFVVAANRALTDSIALSCSAMLFLVLPASSLQHPSTYAGYHIPENSPANVGMSTNARTNSYWYPSAPEADGWKYAYYNLPESYNEPHVNPYAVDNDFSGIGAQFLYPPY